MEMAVIPVSVSDILKVLDQIPIWKSVATLPRRLASLEDRIAALETAKPALPAAPAIDPAKACPMCGSEMKVIAEHSHPIFHFAGLKTHQLKCPDCAFTTTRDFEPGAGYR
jgi:hypothetical protein